jgi:nicotinamidase-related amidase
MHRIDIPAWAIERGRRLNHFRSIACGRSALLVVDMQNAFLLPQQVFGNPHAREIVPNVNRLAALMRRAGGSVVWTRQTISGTPPHAYPDWQFDDGDPAVRAATAALTEGAHGHRLYEGLDIRPDDTVVNKHRYSAFIAHSCDLDARLRARGIDTLIIVGTLTNCCCESSARDANMLGYKVLFASDATAAVTDEEHNAALLNLCLMFADVRSTDELAALIVAASAAGSAAAGLQHP